VDRLLRARSRGEMGRSRKHRATEMITRYDSAVRTTTNDRRLPSHEGRKREEPYCCCCKARHVLYISNTCTFILAIALVFAGGLMNNATKSWELRLFDIMGNLCVGIGCYIMATSLIGLVAARTKSRVAGFVYFLSISVVGAFFLLLIIFVAVEQQKVDAYLQENWDTVSEVLGTEVTFDEAEAIVHSYGMAFLVVAAIGLAALVATLVSAMRILGLRMIAMSQLLALGVLGAGMLTLAALTTGDLPPAMTWILYGCGAVQALCAFLGVIGFKNHHRECIRGLFLVLLLSTAALAYASVGTYRVLLDDEAPENADNVLLTFAVTLTCCLFNATTLLYEAAFYCSQRAAFRAADRAHELPVHFSDNHRKFSKRQRRQWEYQARNAL